MRTYSTCISPGLIKKKQLGLKQNQHEDHGLMARKMGHTLAQIVHTKCEEYYMLGCGPSSALQEQNQLESL